MTPFIAGSVIVAGGFGAMTRFLLDGLISRRIPTDALLGTIVINLTGSFVLGVLTGWSARGFIDATLITVLGVGFIGGYTTFSTASVQIADLLRGGHRRLALVCAAVMAVGATALAGFGFLLASMN